ncbi:polyprotein [Striga asiatica]|uniref:Polyprotein n=1 Tax=Striga asiatica TaxID=4170 RepID=A0A5A7R7K9_STRAF|nr:polyprotein [Striga asiatica]
MNTVMLGKMTPLAGGQSRVSQVQIGENEFKTDQQALKHLLDQKIMTPIQQKWLTKLLGLNYEIQYKRGAENRAADALSRKPNEGTEVSAITTLTPTWVRQIHDSYEMDPFFKKNREANTLDPQAYPDFTLVDGLIRYRGRLGVGSNSQLRESLLQATHDSAFGGHSGILGTYMRMKRTFYWPNMKKDIEKWVKGCDVCSMNKAEKGPYPGLLQPLPIPDKAWTHVSMDFIEGLPKSWGKDVILVIVDRLTKYAHFVALAHPFTAKSVAKTFLDLDTVHKLHGYPVSILTDRDKVFTSVFWKELFKMLGVKLEKPSALTRETSVEGFLSPFCLSIKNRVIGRRGAFKPILPFEVPTSTRALGQLHRALLKDSQINYIEPRCSKGFPLAALSAAGGSLSAPFPSFIGEEDVGKAAP